MNQTYRPEIDGLRAIAILPVVLFHAGVSGFSGGFVGVDVFFVISGYLITRLIEPELSAGTFSFLGFYERRVRRIAPAMFATVLFCVPLAYLTMLPSEIVSFSHSVLATVTLVSNIFFWQDGGYFAADSQQKPLLHMWSLAVEEQYYVLLPLFLALLHRFKVQRRTTVVLALAVLSFMLCEWGWRNAPSANFFLLPTRAWELMMGSAIAIATAQRVVQPSSTISAIGLGMIGYSVFVFDKNTPFPSASTLLPVIGTSLIILFTRADNLIGRVLTIKPIVTIGLLSYSAYLFHQPLFAYVRIAISDELAPSIMFALLAATFLFAYLSWRFVEQPFRVRRGRGVSRKHLIHLFGVASLLGIAVGFLGIAFDGFVGRYPKVDHEIATLDRAKQGRYVQARFNRLDLAPFSSDKRRKVLVIGDSFGQDLVNGLYEAGIQENWDISSFHIGAQCGNVFITDHLERIVDADHKRICAALPGYEDPELRERMQSANLVLLASAWTMEQALLLNESIENIQSVTESPVIVVGRKDFGELSQRGLLDIPAENRSRFANLPTAYQQQVNSRMKEEGFPFIDVQSYFCHEEAACRLFSDDMQLLTFDGSHLTRAGAAYLGAHLLQEPILQPFIASDPAR